MEIERIKRFNQWILAVIGVIGVLLLAGGFFVMAFELLRSWNFAQPAQDPMVAEHIAKKNYDKQKRTHLIQFSQFDLMDTLRQVYMLPVGQNELDELERTSDASSAKVSLSRASKKVYGYAKAGYNNMVVFDAKTGTCQKLFDKRVSITQVFYEQIEEEYYALMSVCQHDTNKDGVLNGNDLLSLFVYSAKDQSLQELQVAGASFLTYHVLQDRQELVLHFGADKNKNGQHEWDEMSFFQKYTLDDKQFTPLISRGLLQELQDLLDGKTN